MSFWRAFYTENNYDKIFKIQNIKFLVK
jgi:hypothetical protein